MIEMKGADYVAAWPHGIARKFGLSVEYVATAINTMFATARLSQFAFYDTHPEERERALHVVGGLTPDQAKQVIAELKRIKHEIAERQRTHCHSCGLPLRDGECEQCGEPL